jgi:hypothetical protein
LPLCLKAVFILLIQPYAEASDDFPAGARGLTKVMARDG